MQDLISRQQAIDQAIDIERNATVDTNPSNFEAHQKFTQFMDDAEVSSFGRWQWSNGFNTALTAVGIDLKKLPSAQPEQRWIPVTERLPEKSGYYLATVDIGWKIVDVIYFNNGSGFLMANRVKAWKPTPEPYHGSKTDIRGEKYD